MRQTQLSGQAAPRIGKWKRLVSLTALFALAAILLFFIKAYRNGEFQSVDSLRAYINSFGVLGPVILTLFQALQVVFPILPGMVGCAAGALLFGVSGGFWYNYLGICAGSLAGTAPVSRRQIQQMVRPAGKEPLLHPAAFRLHSASSGT